MKTPNTSRRHFQLALLALPWTLAAHAARAHGERHGSPSTTVVKEQKPWGIAAEPREATRTVEIRMTDDMKLSPNHLEVREGETLRLRAVNQGRLMHEIVLGTSEELKAHAEMMKKHPGMEHDEPYMAHVPPGRRGDIVWTFNRAGEFEFACLIAGHFEAGMRGTIRVKARP
ncbi:cupredoxin domain-containing protein [Hydrogenophaga sp.]|uniref:cupredoxin domain-containing protein n=1 Tax=Hydrogenophaga sp. TaxID=1904254 RepID=UPI003F70EE12